MPAATQISRGPVRRIDPATPRYQMKQQYEGGRLSEGEVLTQWRVAFRLNINASSLGMSFKDSNTPDTGNGYYSMEVFKIKHDPKGKMGAAQKYNSLLPPAQQHLRLKKGLRLTHINDICLNNLTFDEGVEHMQTEMKSGRRPLRLRFIDVDAGFVEVQRGEQEHHLDPGNGPEFHEQHPSRHKSSFAPSPYEAGPELRRESIMKPQRRLTRRQSMGSSFAERAMEKEYLYGAMQQQQEQQQQHQQQQQQEEEREELKRERAMERARERSREREAAAAVVSPRQMLLRERRLSRHNTADLEGLSPRTKDSRIRTRSAVPPQQQQQHQQQQKYTVRVGDSDEEELDAGRKHPRRSRHHQEGGRADADFETGRPSGYAGERRERARNEEGLMGLSLGGVVGISVGIGLGIGIGLLAYLALGRGGGAAAGGRRN